MSREIQTVQDAIELYRDTPESHSFFWNHFLEQVHRDPLLTMHRDFVEKNLFGYGDRPFHFLWKILVKALGPQFKFLEIGVFKGQTLSLVKLLAPEADVTGVTPLSSVGDHGGVHPDDDYVACLRTIHKEFNLASPRIIKGSSYDPRVQLLARERAPYDLLYVDGCHDYDVVLDDLEIYGQMVRAGGYLVVDDAANDLQVPDGLIPCNFKGLPQVTDALAKYSKSQPNYLHLFSIGHVRVFRLEGR